jgi:hypothetical protein
MANRRVVHPALSTVDFRTLETVEHRRQTAFVRDLGAHSDLAKSCFLYWSVAWWLITTHFRGTPVDASCRP